MKQRKGLRVVKDERNVMAKEMDFQQGPAVPAIATILKRSSMEFETIENKGICICKNRLNISIKNWKLTLTRLVI